MKEFSSDTGGRFTYIDDVLNLQELALAFSAVFTDCDNFIVSGCEVSDTGISSGIVFLNGKLRVFNGVSGVTEWPQYIYEQNTTDNVPYQSGGEKIGRQIWGCASGKSVPRNPTELTGEIPQFITIEKAKGGPLMKDAWFGKYTVLLNPAKGTQTIASDVELPKLTATNTLASRSRIELANISGSAVLSYEGSNLVLQSQGTDNVLYRMVVNQTIGGFQFFRGTTLIATISQSGIVFNSPISCSFAQLGSMRVNGSNLFNSSTASDTGEININVLGLNGADTHYRNTNIGNGKGRFLFQVNGKAGTLALNGVTTIYTSTSGALRIQSDKAKTDPALHQTINFVDNTGSLVSHLGYSSNTEMFFELRNHIGNVHIVGTEYVNLHPVIREGGVALSEKYVLKTTHTSDMAKKMDKTDVYTKTETDNAFAKKQGGLSQFVVGAKTKEVLCSEIGALTASDLEAYPTKANFLADMATDDAAKKKIRDNIGAASAGDYEPRVKDSLWQSITSTLKARQIGNIVCIQGTITTIHSGTVFSIPSNIDPPRYTVGYDAPLPSCGCYWGCKIEAGKKACEVMRCNHHGTTVPISITYMT